MHELSIVQSLIEQVASEVDLAGHTGRVRQLGLVIGRLSGVHCDSVRFAFEVLAPGTLVEGAEMHIAEPKAICRCHACSACSQIEGFVARCPVCESADVSVEGGRELMLQSIEIEDLCYSAKLAV